MVKPTIVFVPGFWEGPAVFASIATTLESPLHDYPTLSITLPSTGKVSPANENLQADVRSIRKQIKPLVDTGKDVILVMHSAGGFLGSNAIEGWSLDARKKAGKQGGIRKPVFLAAGIFPEGTMHADAPFFEKDGAGRLYCAPRTLLFSDLPDAEAEQWISKMQCQPAEGWNDVITYGGWKDVPSVFLIAEEDKILPLELQRQFAAIAGSEVETVKAGHMVILSQPGKCLEVILKAAEA